MKKLLSIPTLCMFLVVTNVSALKSGYYTYTINVSDINTVSITMYNGPDGNVVIPSTIENKSVTSIGDNVFDHHPLLPGIIIPDSVISIGNAVFRSCVNLTNVIISCNIISIGSDVFENCGSLSSVTFRGESIISIGDRAFESCDSLELITIPQSISYIGTNAFGSCSTLSEVYFEGNAPEIGEAIFSSSNPTIYYKPNTSGWGQTFDNQPTVLWYPEIWTDDSSFGIHSNHFGFTIDYWESGLVVVEVCTNLTANNWQPIVTNTMAWGSGYFSDFNYSNHAARYYRLSMP